MKKTILLIAITFLFSTSPVFAHPGRTDSNGGHTCRTNCASWGLGQGEYHYHNGGSTTSNSSAIIPTATPIQQVLPATIAPTRTLTNTIPPTKTPYKETEYDKKKLFKVTRVIDGDTIEVDIRGNFEKIRLLGIDTPETVDPRKPVQCFGKEATNKMKEFVEGEHVKLIDDRSQGNRDKYGRLLRYVYLNNEKKTFVNGEMVYQGYAFSYKQYPTKMLNKFNRFEKDAREHNRGLWGKCSVK